MFFLSLGDAFSVAISLVPSCPHKAARPLAGGPGGLSGYKSIMQNKANVKMGNININTAILKAYANKQRTMINEHYSKQTQSNPIPPPRRDEIRDTKTVPPRYAIRHTRYEIQTQFQTHKQLTLLAGGGVGWDARVLGGA